VRSPDLGILELVRALALLVLVACVGDEARLVPPECDAGDTACGEVCVDLNLDPAHCGSCDQACDAGAVCLMGACETCGGGTTPCGDACVDTKVDPQNCGGCGTACRGNEVCAQGMCSTQCGDGVMNGFETDVDCGGPLCNPCVEGKSCGMASDCDTFFCNGGTCEYAPSCAAIKDGVPSAADGPYTIDPDGAGGEPPLAAACLMSVLGGGWTLVQRTVWDFAQSGQLLTDYATFYGSTIGAPDPDSAYRIAGRHWPALNTAKDILVVHTARKEADGMSCEPLYYAGVSGTWSVPEGGGASISGVVQSVPIHDSTAWSTTDNGPSAGCVTGNSAVPWTYSGCCSTCPTFAGGYYDPARPMTNYLTAADAFGRNVTTQCAEQAAVISNTYYGLNRMEYYLR
jgi:hypothetical protein